MMDLAGKRVFVVEDETVIALVLVELIEEMGGVVTATAEAIEDAVYLAAHAAFDIAILDLNLQGERVDRVAKRIEARGLPMIFATGYGPEGVPDAFRKWPVVGKPYSNAELVAALQAALEMG